MGTCAAVRTRARTFEASTVLRRRKESGSKGALERRSTSRKATSAIAERPSGIRLSEERRLVFAASVRA